MALHRCLGSHMNSTFVFFPNYKDNFTKLLVTVYLICNLLSVRDIFTPLILLIHKDEGLPVCFVSCSISFFCALWFLSSIEYYIHWEKRANCFREVYNYKKNPISTHLFNLALLHRSQKQVQWICAKKKLLFYFLLKILVN